MNSPQTKDRQSIFSELHEANNPIPEWQKLDPKHNTFILLYDLFISIGISLFSLFFTCCIYAFTNFLKFLAALWKKINKQTK